MVKNGMRAEKEALRFGIIKRAKKMSYHSPYDYEIYGLKIDVKSATQKIKTYGNQFRFVIKRKKHLADFYLCMGYSESKLKSAYLLPSCICDLEEVVISAIIPNNYDQYRIL